jgi:hypothetical protein
MNSNLQYLVEDVHVAQSSTLPDYRFTNYPFAQQNLNDKPLPQGEPATRGKPLGQYFSDR